MKKHILSVVLALATIFSAGVTTIAVNGDDILETKETAVYQPIITATPTNGETVSLLDTESGIYQVTSNYKKSATKKYYEKGVDLYFPAALTISWESTETAEYYTLKLGMKKDLSDAKSFATFDTSITLKDLFVAKKYYYQVIARCENKTVVSRIFEFKTAALPRTITVPSVSNTRDLGGYFTTDGKYQVKQGMIYRGAAIDNITEEGKAVMLKTYGIKTDLDIRGTTDHTQSPLGSNINYVKCLGPDYCTGGSGINSANEEYRNGLLKEIKTFAVKENYPIYIHCAIGRDRTGTLCFLLNALLGVGENDLFMDHEISFFSEAGSAGNFSQTVGSFGQLYKYILDYSDGSLQENTEKFMLDLGVTQAEIDGIREIMLEEVQA